jgi:hypothetical protein
MLQLATYHTGVTEVLGNVVVEDLSASQEIFVIVAVPVAAAGVGKRLEWKAEEV